MCGRYALFHDPAELAREFGTVNPFPERPRYNLPPGEYHPVVRQQPDGERFVLAARWGLLPSWVRDPKAVAHPINAKSETAAAKPMFRHAMRRARVLVPASGWYEWRSEGGVKQPYYFARADGHPLAFAGLLEHWSGFDGESVTYAILTTTANPALAEIHDRMPVVLEAAEQARWLDPGLVDPKRLEDLLVPAADGIVQFHRVGRRVNRPREDDPGLIEAE